MTDIDALRALHDAVKAGSNISWGWAAGPARAVFGDKWHDAMDAYLGSLDAAHALHKAVLPGWGWCSATDAHGEQWFSLDDPSGDFETEETYADNPARAWLLAILAALIAEAEARAGKGE